MLGKVDSNNDMIIIMKRTIKKTTNMDSKHSFSQHNDKFLLLWSSLMQQDLDAIILDALHWNDDWFNCVKFSSQTSCLDWCETNVYYAQEYTLILLKTQDVPLIYLSMMCICICMYIVLRKNNVSCVCKYVMYKYAMSGIWNHTYHHFLIYF